MRNSLELWDHLPAFDCTVDAVFGFSFAHGEVRAPFADVLAALAAAAELRAGTGSAAVAADGAAPAARPSVRRTEFEGLPVISVDVPSGWAVDGGAAGELRPSALVSLTAPKPVAEQWAALTRGVDAPRAPSHWLGGRFVPRGVAARFGIAAALDLYAGDEQVARLF